MNESYMDDAEDSLTDRRNTPESVYEEKMKARRVWVEDMLHREYSEYIQTGANPLSETLRGFDEEGDMFKGVVGVGNYTKMKRCLENVSFEDEQQYVASQLECFDLKVEIMRDENIRLRLERYQNANLESEGIFYVTTPEKERLTEISEALDLEEGASVIQLDLIMDEMGDKQSLGLHELTESLGRVARRVKEDPSIKFVVGCSWLLSHPIARKLGFNEFNGPSVKPRNDSTIHGTVARAGSETASKMDQYKTVWAAIPREELLEKFLKDEGVEQ